MEAEGRVFLFSLAGDHGHDGAYLSEDAIFWRRDGRIERAVYVSDIPLRGRHNVANVAAATAIAAACDIGPVAISQAVRAFKAPPHRLEFVATRARRRRTSTTASRRRRSARWRR